MAGMDDYEVARQSPLGFCAKATKARYLAYCHWTMKEGTPLDGSDVDVDESYARAALFEGWLRESSLALELIAKAVFAQGEQGKEQPRSVPSNHNVPQIWKMAGLPALPREQEYHLALAYQVLQWSGRYEAPLKSANDLFDLLNKLRPKERLGAAFILKRHPSAWESFDAIYRLAEREYVARSIAYEESLGVPF